MSGAKYKSPDDIIGVKFNKLTVIGVTEVGPRAVLRVKCRCDCGRVLEDVMLSSLRSGNTKTCGHCNNKRLDIINGIYGDIQVLAEDHYDEKSRAVMWLCRDLSTGGTMILTYDQIRSHGKKKFVRNVPYAKKHGLSEHPAYDRYYDILSRCYNLDDPAFILYGGAGKRVCDEWLPTLDDPYIGLKHFTEWCDNTGFSPELTVERRDGEMGYFIDNCYWATRKAQMHNVNWNQYIYDGEESLIYADFEAKYHIKEGRVGHLINDSGYTRDEVVSIAKHNLHRHFIKKNGLLMDRQGFIYLVRHYPQNELFTMNSDEVQSIRKDPNKWRQFDLCEGVTFSRKEGKTLFQAVAEFRERQKREGIP